MSPREKAKPETLTIAFTGVVHSGTDPRASKGPRDSSFGLIVRTGSEIYVHQRSVVGARALDHLAPQ